VFPGFLPRENPRRGKKNVSFLTRFRPLTDKISNLVLAAKKREEPRRGEKMK